MRNALTVLCGAAALVSSVAFAAPPNSIAECQQAADQWKAAYNSHNLDALVGMYDAKNGMTSAEAWTATGRDALAAGFKQEFSAGVMYTNITCDRSNRVGHHLLSRGTWTATANGPDGKPATVSGHWASVGEDRGKELLILTLIGNTQSPPPPAK
ncbi:MAG TPA: nuclear transport factor 2 family protein [Acidisphaera sp.]|nr:nuclear transport factor 2 family protein [Acidisphaera sp.]